IVERRNFVTVPDLRFFLAVLLNVAGRETIYRLIKQRYPDSDPQEKVLDWTFDLANTRVVGIEPPTALGIENFGDIDIAVLEEMLNGKDETAIDASLRGHGASVEDLASRMTAIRSSPLLGTLFA